MSDSVLLPGDGIQVHTETIGASEMQRIKIVTGAKGVDGGDVTIDNPLPVLTPTEVVETLEALRMAIQGLSRTVGQAMPDVAGRLRVALDAISGSLTLANVTTVANVTALGTLTTLTTLNNQSQVGGISAVDMIPSLARIGAESLRRNITVT